jgi:hypothetical protein
MSANNQPPSYFIIPQGDNIENNLVIYTLSAAIAVALLIYILGTSPPCSQVLQFLRPASAIALGASVIFIFMAIERLFDIVSSRKNKGRSYYCSLILYNLSIAFIVFSIIAILLCFFAKEYSCLCNQCASVLLLILGAIIYVLSSYNWWRDIYILIFKPPLFKPLTSKQEDRNSTITQVLEK